MQISAYTISLLLSALVSAGLAIYAWRRRSVTAGTELALLMLAVAVWSLCVAIEGMVTAHHWKVFWSATAYFGSQSTPVLFLLFALRYTQQDKWLSARRIALLFVVPAASVVIAFINGLRLHGLLWPQITFPNTWAGVTDVYAHGVWYWIEVAYGYSLILIGVIALLRAVFRLRRPYTWQARIIVLATLIPIGVHLVYSFLPKTVEGLDITPIAFTLTGLLVALAVFGFQLLDLRPIASNVVYDGIRDAIVAIDREERVVDINQPALSLVNGEAEVIGRPAADVFASLPSVAEKLDGGLDGALGEIEVDRDGTILHYDLRVWPLKDGRDRLLGKLLTMHDVTEIRQAQEELKRINAELDGYAHTVSHDLKGPLTAISLANDTIEKLLEMPETEERDATIVSMAEVVSSNTRKATEFINGLLVLAEAGQKPGYVVDVDVTEVVNRVLKERAQQIESCEARVETHELGVIRADHTHIYQLFSNIIGNAVKHGCGTPGTALEVRLLKSGTGLHKYLVRDSGPGIPPEDLDKIFTPFFKGERTGETGIGLSTSKRIVDVYGGAIRAYNDGGACFEISLRDYNLERDLRTPLGSGLYSCVGGGRRGYSGCCSGGVPFVDVLAGLNAS